MMRLDLKVKYKDGTVVWRENVPYHSIERDKVRFAQVADRDTDKVLYQISIAGDETFAYRRRTRMSLGHDKDVCHILAKYTPQGKKIAFVFEETESIVVKDSFVESHGWFYPIELFDYEKKEYMD